MESFVSKTLAATANFIDDYSDDALAITADIVAQTSDLIHETADYLSDVAEDLQDYQHGGNHKVKVELYFESQCPGCRSMITTSFAEAFATEGFLKMADVQFFPYGNAHETGSSSEGWTFDCQHGVTECNYNAIETCGLNIIRGKIRLRGGLHCCGEEGCEEQTEEKYTLQNCLLSSLHNPTHENTTLGLAYQTLPLGSRPLRGLTRIEINWLFCRHIEWENHHCLEHHRPCHHQSQTNRLANRHLYRS